VGSSGTILHTTNGGITWIKQSSGTTNDLEGIFFIDANTGTIVGDRGTVLHTTNGSTTWTSQLCETNNNLLGVSFISANTGTVVGWYGTILHTANGGVAVSVDENQICSVYTAQKYCLDQNYPNPFNPTTTISFSLPSKSFVSIKVFDLIGREVATIISEELQPGNYSRQWNAEYISSGIYFYRLRANSFTETKKLILLR
jgi:hypothetical protein